jgi:hypothetical protein
MGWDQCFGFHFSKPDFPFLHLTLVLPLSNPFQKSSWSPQNYVGVHIFPRGLRPRTPVNHGLQTYVHLHSIYPLHPAAHPILCSPPQPFAAHPSPLSHKPESNCSVRSHHGTMRAVLGPEHSQCPRVRTMDCFNLALCVRAGRPNQSCPNNSRLLGLAPWRGRRAGGGTSPPPPPP